MSSPRAFSRIIRITTFPSLSDMILLSFDFSFFAGEAANEWLL